MGENVFLMVGVYERKHRVKVIVYSIPISCNACSKSSHFFQDHSLCSLLSPTGTPTLRNFLSFGKLKGLGPSFPPHVIISGFSFSLSILSQQFPLSPALSPFPSSVHFPTQLNHELLLSQSQMLVDTGKQLSTL